MQSILEKRRLVRKDNPSPWDLLEGFGMQHPTLLDIISDNNQIQTYSKIQAGKYFCDHNDSRILLNFIGYNKNTATCDHLSLEIGKPFFFYDVKDCYAFKLYIKDGQLIKEKITK
ncbi:MAG: hypothetical protein JSW73_04205 [Candidatus Woesearchaeota archaeon]|nr:MAG: hypothetical protein JSW73_04205 [Candidatus Woesearchaeota archaeon]